MAAAVAQEGARYAVSYAVIWGLVAVGTVVQEAPFGDAVEGLLKGIADTLGAIDHNDRTVCQALKRLRRVCGTAKDIIAKRKVPVTPVHAHVFVCASARASGLPNPASDATGRRHLFLDCFVTCNRPHPQLSDDAGKLKSFQDYVNILQQLHYRAYKYVGSIPP